MKRSFCVVYIGSVYKEPSAYTIFRICVHTYIYNVVDIYILMVERLDNNVQFYLRTRITTQNICLYCWDGNVSR